MSKNPKKILKREKTILFKHLNIYELILTRNYEYDGKTRINMSMFHLLLCKKNKVLYHPDVVSEGKYLCLIFYAGKETEETTLLGS